MTPAEFWDRVEPQPSGCWEWIGSRNQQGYGYAYLGGRQDIASRAAWRLVWGEIPKRMLVCHRCDNPPCVRPSHLFLGTSRDNVRDARDKGRLGKVRRPRLIPEDYAQGLPGLVLRDRRLIAGLTQTDLAYVLGTRHSAVSLAEGREYSTGRQTRRHLRAIELIEAFGGAA